MTLRVFHMIKLKALFFLLSLLAPTLVWAETELVLHASLPKKIYAEGPSSGQFRHPDQSKAFFLNKQPILSFSSILATNKVDIFWCLTDNGFGKKNNSADYIPRLYELKLDKDGNASYQKRYLQFTDPDKKLSFPIQADYEHYYNDIRLPNVDISIKENRLLTGADINPESIQIDSNHHLWIAESFGPFLIETNNQGKVLNQQYVVPAIYSKELSLKTNKTANLSASDGIAAMAISPNKESLKLILQHRVKKDHNEQLLFYTFNILNKQFESDFLYYPINANTRVTDMVALDQKRFYVLERNSKQHANLVYEIDLNYVQNSILKKKLLLNLNQWIPAKHSLKAIEIIDHDKIMLVNHKNSSEDTFFSIVKSDLLKNENGHNIVNHHSVLFQEQQNTLKVVKFGLKEGYLNDNDAIGWIITGMYLLIIMVFLRATFLARTYNVDCWFWYSLTIFVLFLGINKQFDIQTDITNFLREIARTDGWYEHRAELQKELLELGLIGIFVGIATFSWFFKKYWIKYKFLWIGFAMLIAYLVITLISWHALDRVIRYQLFSIIKVNQLVEMNAILLLFISGLQFNKSYFEKARSIHQRHYNGIYTIYYSGEYINCPDCYSTIINTAENLKLFKCRRCGYKFQTILKDL